MVRVTDYAARRKEILRAVIELYLETAHPVSSEMLLERYRFDLSSASIRNVLKELEEKDYLTHPHTSAGRIPTDRGYRFYVDDLMRQVELSHEEKKILGDFFSFYFKNRDDIFSSASRILSQLTHYAGITSYEKNNDIYYCGFRYLLEQPEFSRLEEARSIFRAMEEDRLLDILHKQMDGAIEVLIGNESHCTEMTNCSLIVCECKNRYGDAAKIALLGPRRMAYHRVIPMMSYMADLIEGEIL